MMRFRSMSPCFSFNFAAHKASCYLFLHASRLLLLLLLFSIVSKANQDDLKKVTGEFKDLVQATKAAQSDLVNARKRFEANQKREAEKQKKEEDKRIKQDKDARGKRPKVRRQSEHAVLNAEMMSALPELPRYTADAGSDWASSAQRLLLEPWVQRPGSSSMNNFPDLNELLHEFAQAFKQSALRVTDGRATKPVPEGSKFFKQLQRDDVVDESCLLGFEDFQSVYSIAFPATPLVLGEAAKKLLCPAMFAIAQNHCSIAKVEPGLLGTLRYHHSGSYLVSIWLPQDLAGPAPKDFFKEVSDCVSKATPEEIKERGTARLFFMGTVSEGDLLYIPPGAVVSLQAGSFPDSSFQSQQSKSCKRTNSCCFFLAVKLYVAPGQQPG